MKINQFAYPHQGEVSLLVNAISYARQDTEYLTNFQFVDISEITWSVGSIGYIELQWVNTEETAFVLSGTGKLNLKAIPPKLSDGGFKVRYVNFSENDAAMFCVRGSVK